MNIGIIGTGNIASYLLEQVNKNRMADGRIIAVFGRNVEAGTRLKKRFGIEFHTDFQEFLSASVDTVVEAVTMEAASLFIKQVAEHKKDLIVSSIGVFKDLALLEELTSLAEANGTTIYLPSGAIGGLDVLQSANALGGLESVQLTTRKSPQSLGMETGQEQVLFDGTAFDAVGKFPKNINIALVLAIAGIGVHKTAVRIIVDPAIERNTHTVEAQGDFGKMQLKVENEPMAANPKTSLLAAMSILSVLQHKGRALRIGS